MCDENEVLVRDPPSGAFPSTFWSGDRYRCPKCGHQIITGFATKGIPGDYMPIEEAENALQFTHQ